MQDVRRQIGVTIQRLRRSQNLSQEELAHAAGIDRAYMSKIERGLPDLGLMMIIRLAKALKIHPAELLKELDVTES